MDIQEYLLSYGTMGDFGRFRPTTPLAFQRGARVIARSYRGLELAVVLREATAGHAHFLPNTTLGKLLRLATPADEEKAERMGQRSQQVFNDARRLAGELALPLEVLDAEVMLDGKQAYLHHLSWSTYDERELISRLSQLHDLQVALHSLTLPREEEHAEEAGCGRPGCGQSEGGGGCGSCGTGGGCSSCGSTKPAEVEAHFVKLREEMIARNRTPLL